MSADRLLTIAETCNYLSTSPLTLRRLRAEGILRAYRIRRAIRFKLDEVLEALARADEEYGVRRREALIPSGGPKNKINAMFNGKLKGLCNLNTIDLVETNEKEDSDNNKLQAKESGRVVKKVQRNNKANSKRGARRSLSNTEELIQSPKERKRGGSSSHLAKFAKAFAKQAQENSQPHKNIQT